MKQVELIMGMPVTVEIVGETADTAFNEVFDYFRHVDARFSTYKETSEISRFNRGEIAANEVSEDMKEIFRLADETKKLTDGYFDIFHDGCCDPSGIVKGWAIYNAAQILWQRGYKNFYVDAGSDIQTSGMNEQGQAWRTGIKNPFRQEEMVKIVRLTNQGIATSGSYIRGDHIYNPKGIQDDTVMSVTVIAPNIYEADRFATSAFAMGARGVSFIAALPGLEAYMIDTQGMAHFTPGFETYVEKV